MSNSTSFAPTNTTLPAPVAPTPLIIAILTYVDYVNRVWAMLIFLAYFLLLALMSELRTKSLLYVHHVNVIGCLFCLMYIFYFEASLPTFADARLNDVLCGVSEATWSMLKYLRPYSILLVALYRYVAVMATRLFKTVNHSTCSLVVPLCVSWLVAAGFFVTTKFGFGTTYGSPLCIDGYSASATSVIGYLAVTTLISMVVPFVAISSIYVAIKLKLNSNMKKVRMSVSASPSRQRRWRVDTLENQVSIIQNNVSDMNETNNFTNNKARANTRTDIDKKTRLNTQLILINVCNTMCFAVSFVLSFRYVISDFNSKFYYFRQLLRILNIFFQSLIPIISIYFCPDVKNKLTNRARRAARHLTISKHRQAK